MIKVYNTSYFRLLIACFAIGAAWLFDSCRKDDAVETDIGYGYFPTEIGHWVMYEIDSTVYDDFEGDTDVYRYQVKEVLESEFLDNEGRPSIRVERYRRNFDPLLPYDSIPWYLSRVWYFTRTAAHAEKMEENQRYIRLAFAAADGKTWDGNAYNTIGAWNYKYVDVDVPYSIGAFAFDSTCLVEQKKEINLINHRTYHERYAKNVGLIEKNVIDVHDTGFAPVPVINRIHDGVIYNIKLVDYGPR
jgi:hypothetical protein